MDVWYTVDKRNTRRNVKMKLYLSRHGETDVNTMDRVCGLTEAMLTEKGRAQAAALGERVKGLGIDIIISSPMKRARETSAIASEICGAQIVVDDRLIEQNYGIYEGVDRYHEGFLANKRMFAYKYPGGESMMQVAYRTYSFIEDLKEKYAGKNVLVICHGGVCRVLRTYFVDMTNDEFFRYSMDNAGLEEYEL